MVGEAGSSQDEAGSGVEPPVEITRHLKLVHPWPQARKSRLTSRLRLCQKPDRARLCARYIAMRLTVCCYCSP